MTTLAEQLRDFLLADATVSGLVEERVHQAIIPDAARSVYPRIWFRRAAVDGELNLDGGATLPQTTFDLEVLTDDIEQLDTLADAVRARLHGYPPTGTAGSWGTRQVLGVFCEDQSDDYIPFAINDDEGTHFAALSVVVCHGA